MRAIVRIFRRSPTKNDAILQPYVKRELGKELSLVLDCRTRWNSLYDMLARFIQLRNPVQKAMIDLKEPVQVTEADFACVQDIVSSLEPVKLAVKALCQRDTNLITAETALHFCLIELQKQSSELAKTLASSIEDRLRERRALHAGVLQYLHCPSTASSRSASAATELFSIPTNAAIKKFVHEMYTRLQRSDTEASASSAASEAASGTDGDCADNVVKLDDSADRPSSTTNQSQSQSLEKQLELAIMQSVMMKPSTLSSSSTAAEKNLASAVKAEMAVFASNGQRGRCLEAVYGYLMTIPPTSVEAERAFSAAGLLCTKLRSRLNDTTIDTLSFIRAYYQSCK